VSLKDLYTILFRHSRVNGNPVALVLDSLRVVDLPEFIPCFDTGQEWQFE